MNSDYETLLAPPDIGSTEIEAVVECLKENWISTTGPYSNKLGSEVAALLGKKYFVATNSGTSALELSLIGVGVGRGDYVALPSWTFSADPNAILAVGAVPVFVDIDDKLGLCGEKLEQCIREQIKKGKPISAILAVHPPNGVFNLHDITSIAEEYALPVVEDSAGSLFSKIGGKYLGGLTEVGCVSFNGNKIITGGSGGLVITDNHDIYERCNAHAVNSQTSAYIANVAGSNRLMVNVCASIALAQFARRSEILKSKATIFDFYRSNLKSLTFCNIPLAPDPEFRSNNWMFYILLKDGVDGNQVVKFFEQHKIQVRTFWRSLPDEKAYNSFQCYGKTTAQRAARQVVCLPCGTALSIHQMSKVVDLLYEFGAKYV